jgi:hypothetical protein
MHLVSSVGSDKKLDEIMDFKSNPFGFAMRIMCADTGLIRSNNERHAVRVRFVLFYICT